MPKSTPAYRNFVPGSSPSARSRHSLLIAMARDVEKLAAQAERLKELRKMARVSQVTAAHAIGVTPRGYQEWEAGRSGISGDKLKATAEYFGTSPDYIEYGIVDPKRPRTPDLSSGGPPGGWNELLDRLSSIEDQLQKLGGAVAELVAAEAERARREGAQRRRRPPGGNQ